MHIEVEPKIFNYGMGFLGSMCRAKSSTMPILKNVILESLSGSQVDLVATDLETCARVTLATQVREAGVLCIPGTLLSQITKEGREGEPVVIRAAENGHAKLTWGKSEFRINGADPSEFPKIEDALRGEMAIKIAIQGEALADLVKRVVHAAAPAGSYGLAGVFLELEDGALRATATDGHRLASATAQAVIERVKADSSIKPLVSTHLAGKLQEIGKMAKDWVELSLSASGVCARAESKPGARITLGGRYLEAGRSFPAWRDIVPKSHSTAVQVDRALLKSALSRVAILAGPTVQGVKLLLGEGGFMMTLQNPDAGHVEETVAGEIQGEKLEIQVNVHYLLDAAEAAPEGAISAEFAGPESPLVIRVRNNESFLALVMPMRA